MRERNWETVGCFWRLSEAKSDRILEWLSQDIRATVRMLRSTLPAEVWKFFATSGYRDLVMVISRSGSWDCNFRTGL